MSAPSPDLAELVKLFLPIDPVRVDQAATSSADLAMIAASMGSFSAAAFHSVSPMSPAERNDFCRRVSTQSDGQVPAWTVEACLRSFEGDLDALAGTDPAITTGVPIYGLVVLGAEYLSPNEAISLRDRATEIAGELLPQLEALPHE